MKIVIIGGGWAGCAAALGAAKQGAHVVLLERTDMLLGTGLVGGIMRSNGRFTATEELIAMGGGEIFHEIDKNSPYTNIEFPGHYHASLYNVGTMEPMIKRFLEANGVHIVTSVRITGVDMSKNRIIAVSGQKDGEAVEFDGDAFIDTTGTGGPPANCNKYGNGCVMCILRCHTYGGRISVAAKAGVMETSAVNGNQTGAMSGSCKLHKESLSPEIVGMLDLKGVAVIPIPEPLRRRGKLELKVCQQYAIPAFEENVILLNTGHAKLMGPFFPLDVLRQIRGFENARFEDPYSGGTGNSIRFIGFSPRDDALKVEGMDNLFCAGEKAGPFVGHTEAICTGTLAGFNAAGYIKGEEPLVLPNSLSIGDAISHVRIQMGKNGGPDKKYTFSGSVLFERMKDLDLYTTDIGKIEQRVHAAGMSGVFS